MKNKIAHLLSATFLLLSLSIASGQTASDFTANDCSGTSHHLFSELDAGRIVVICFVMPCATCIGPAQAAYTTVQEYKTTHPGKVLFYLADDFANTPCGTLVSWANNNGMSGVVSFSHKDVTETPYGSGGMPKTVVLGGWNHKVHFVENSGLNTVNLKKAINTALSLTSLREEGTKAAFNLNIHPNPAVNSLIVEYVLPQTASIGIDIYAMTGILVKHLEPETLEPGEHTIRIDLSELSEGIYYLRLKEGHSSSAIKLAVKR